MNAELKVVKELGKGRVGYINLRHKAGNENESGTKETTVEVPSTLIYTRYGRVPHMTEDVERFLPTRCKQMIRRFRLCDLFEESVSQSLKASNKVYKKFTNSKESDMLFCSVQDTIGFSSVDFSKYAEEKSISVWTQSGRRKVTSNGFMEALSMSGVEMAECLCDITPVGAGDKRCKKSVDRTLKHLDHCIQISQENPEKYNFALFGAIVGGDNVKERRRCAVETSKRDVQGFVLEGFDKIGDDFNEILQTTLEYLPPDKPKIMLGSFNPERTLEAILNGVDIVDNSYVYELTERGCAAVFTYRTKKMKTHSDQDPVTNVLENGPQSTLEIELSQKRYKDDFKPILSTCNCMTCLKYTRAYLNHLLVTNEMLAQVLLMMHNMHHFGKFLEEIRTAMSEATLDSLKDLLVSTSVS
ncbi:queuine tRNA-ribosyltransferase accessory subunit 2-like [Rhopilema esculentum]|uniref:queuine tRNA-ribosyltransferase accessory subunit 2-like n=1 Tax=Rhopilema esculentum TaxID=499914 RepID=UPI0031DCCA79